MPGIVSVSLQNIMHGSEPEVRKRKINPKKYEGGLNSPPVI